MKLCSIKVYNKLPLCQIDVGATTPNTYNHTTYGKLCRKRIIIITFTRLDVLLGELGSVKEQDLKSKTLELTKNLPIYNKAGTNTINYLSKKAKVSSRTDCSIL
ncbi:MAG: hypothetical protein DMENIID0002_01670 [Rickettsia endosymbiont of Sergentomyia squamirostris]|uniref:Uncharacterized protein n=1 Tax=Candidatus Tisiphia endosymbiont of Sergentomyia squamirostris TaxID=3113639 RepID=A0AAT9G6Q3_9RICK